MPPNVRSHLEAMRAGLLAFLDGCAVYDECRDGDRCPCDDLRSAPWMVRLFADTLGRVAALPEPQGPYFRLPTAAECEDWRNHPAHVAAVLALYDARDAGHAFLRGRGADYGCPVYSAVAGILYATGQLVASLHGILVEPEIIRRRAKLPGLDREEPVPAEAAPECDPYILR